MKAQISGAANWQAAALAMAMGAAVGPALGEPAAKPLAPKPQAPGVAPSVVPGAVPAKPAQTTAAKAAVSLWPASVTSAYKLYFNGFEVGTFSFKSTSNGKTYAATSVADVSALFGAFKWKGTTAASGGLNANGPAPSSYLLTYRTKSKSGAVRLGFDLSGVKTVSVEPKKDLMPEAVPVKPEHMKNVFDPMSAVLYMTHAGPGDPCAKKIPIFDGKVRFNLTLAYKGRQRLEEKASSGQPTELVVCKAKYDPVSGHKPKDFESPWVDYSGIEIALRPVPSAGVYVPYTITIPTTIGAAVMSAERIDITMPGQSVIALTR